MTTTAPNGGRTDAKTNAKTNAFAVLQKVGQSLMIPVSVLPAAGIMVAIGRMLMSSWPEGLGHTVGNILFSGGLAIFEQLPLVFAVGVAIGFTGGAGVAGLAAVVGYFGLMNVIKALGAARHIEPAINTGVFGGIAVGLLSAALYNRFFQTKLHPVLGFFSGKRLVPILTAGAAIVLGLVLGFTWPPIQSAIANFGEMVMNSSWGPAFYAAGKRLLIPVGLHHVYYPSFLFEFGQFALPSGEILHGDSPRYFAGDITAGRFMASEFPIMLFGLPAAALAMYLRAKKEVRRAIGGVMLSAALTSILTGITEPIEFSFIFVAPVLYVFHVMMAFVSGALTAHFDIHLGYTFSASAIDFVLGYFNQKNSMYLFALVGPLIGLGYFSVFYAAIGLLQLKTPGREEDAVAGNGLSGNLANGSGMAAGSASSDKAARILAALGNARNIAALDACITRLRLRVHNASLVDKAALKALGAAGILDAGGGNFQIIFGTESDHLKEEILSHMSQGGVDADAPQGVSVFSPLQGAVVSLDQVPDPVFAQGTMGGGVAIDPTEGVVRAPFDGDVVQIFKTAHAVGLKNKQGVEVLIHIGIDTVQMKGRGFKALVKKGDPVKKGDKLIEFDLDLVKKEAKSSITPVVVTNSSEVKGVSTTAHSGAVTSEDVLLNVDV